jgi:predicted DNA binding protein
MTIVAEFSVPHEEFALSSTFAAVPDLVLAVERTVAHAPEWVMPYVWVVGGPPDVTAELRADESTETVRRRADAESGMLYEVEWSATVRTRVHWLLEHGAIPLSLVGRRGGWQLRLRVPEHERLADMQSLLREHGYSPTLRRLEAPESPDLDRQFVITEKQRQALLVAQESGYYDIPRETTMAELAAELGISQQAFSKRLRRAHEALSEEVLAVCPEPTIDGR